MYVMMVIQNIIIILMIKCGRDESELEQQHGGGREEMFLS